jgi:hypothetical protein
MFGAFTIHIRRCRNVLPVFYIHFMRERNVRLCTPQPLELGDYVQCSCMAFLDCTGMIVPLESRCLQVMLDSFSG